MLRKGLAVVCMAWLLLLTGLAQADERILSYHSDIQVNPDRSLIVTETIQVRAEGNKIKRGIYRDFPTRYTDHYGNDYHVGFQVLSDNAMAKRKAITRKIFLMVSVPTLAEATFTCRRVNTRTQ